MALHSAQLMSGQSSPATPFEPVPILPGPGLGLGSGLEQQQPRLPSSPPGSSPPLDSGGHSPKSTFCARQGSHPPTPQSSKRRSPFSFFHSSQTLEEGDLHAQQAGSGNLWIHQLNQLNLSNVGGSMQFSSKKLPKRATGREKSIAHAFGDSALIAAPKSNLDRSPRLPRYVIKEGTFYSLWQMLIATLLVYTGTVFVYVLCFIDFKIDVDNPELTGQGSHKSLFIDVLDTVVYVIFIIDFFLGFFFSYKDVNHVEVIDLPRCMRHYLRSTFVINFFSCLPPGLVTMVVQGNFADHGKLNQGIRVIRLQRLTKLFQIFRMPGSHLPTWLEWMETTKVARVLNLTIGLFWIIHLMACGWYLCAAFHDDPSMTWVATYKVSNSKTVAELNAFDSWMQSVYFVITVFTTVGFGDISATTNGEIVYVFFLMMVGVVVHSMIIGEVIAIVTSNDRVNEFVKGREALLDAFSEHTELDQKSREKLSHWIYTNARHWVKQQYSKEDMKQLIIGRYMPRTLLGELPPQLYHGQLTSNKLLTCVGKYPPRLPMLLALHMGRSTFIQGETVYEKGDHPFNLFMVRVGTFAATRTSFLPAPDRDAQPIVTDEVCELYPWSTYFGDREIFRGTPRLTSAICCSDLGIVMAIPRKEMEEVVDEFPQAARAWSKRARRKDRFLSEMGAKTSLDLAALRIQQYWRNIRNSQRPGRISSPLLQSRLPTVQNLMTLPDINPERGRAVATPISVDDGTKARRATTSSGNGDDSSRLRVVETKVDMLDQKVNAILSMLKTLMRDAPPPEYAMSL
mmetsp:Transcript_42067/g.90892  ORF Transcript_42067/g.90892 Transcript_42067/m.90892 type:complete len:795 (+) Transcript_42067:213-2597(+)